MYLTYQPTSFIMKVVSSNTLLWFFLPNPLWHNNIIVPPSQNVIGHGVGVTLKYLRGVLFFPITIHLELFTICFDGNPWCIIFNGEDRDIDPQVKTEVCPLRDRRYIATQPRLQVLMYASHICDIDADGKLELDDWENRAEHSRKEST